MKFKKGDKVRRIVPVDDEKLYGKLGNIYTVNKYVFKKGMILDELPGGCSPESFELVSESNELEELVKKANEGYLAIKKLHNYLDQIEVKIVFKNEKDDDKWEKLESEPTDHMEYRIKPKTRKFKVANWDAEINGNEVKIGCKTFDLKWLKTELNLMCKKDSKINCSDNGKTGISACRMGISCSGNTITWEQAEELLKELEK